MGNLVSGSSALLQLTSSEIKCKINQRHLFGLEELQKQLFGFCKTILTADKPLLSQLSFYDLAPSVLLYGPPNTGKTTLSYLIFNQIKEEVTNEINFYTLDVGRMLDPALGQSYRNLEQIFDYLHKICSDGSSAFLLLDELDMFCMSRSRAQEHDAVRRAMTTLMLELDKLQIAISNNLLVFGITNVPDLIDTAVVRRFSFKSSVNPCLSWLEFKAYMGYLNQPIQHISSEEELQKLYSIYQERGFTVGDIKALYQTLIIDILCNSKNNPTSERLICMFNQGFSSQEHLHKTTKEVLNV